MKKVFFSVFLITVFQFLNAQEHFSNTNNESGLGSFVELNDKYLITPTGINSKLSDIGSTIFMNKYIMYSSRKTGAIGAGRDENTNNPYNALYCMNVDKNGSLSHPYFFASVLDGNGNEGGLAFSPDQKTVYYTKSEAENSKNFQLYKRIFDEECRCTWKQEEAVVFNSVNYSIENPSVSPDGKKMYFSSNMPGGFGGFDLYVADINDKGMPVNPKNLGLQINTSADETFPYVSPTNRELYFSSNGHLGYGNQDVFMTRIKKDYYAEPVNLGKTINTNLDDVAFIFISKNKGFITSNRSSSLGSYDIYKFDLQLQPVVLSGIAFEKNSKIALPNTEIALLDEEGNVVEKTKTNENGGFKFENVNPLDVYTIQAEKDGYNEVKIPIQTKAENTVSNVELEQKKAVVTFNAIVIENIFFDFNKASVKTESTLSLNKIYEVLVANPDMKIIIKAHTDTRGSDKYNMILSEKRAQSALNYLIKKGIDADRISAKGYGETQPLSNCGNNCTEKQFDADRRVEFEIVR